MIVLPPPVVTVGPASSSWDPGPRRPRLWPASLLAFLIFVGAAAYGGWGYYDLIGARHTAREDLCPLLDLGAAEAALGPLTLRESGGSSEAAPDTSQTTCVYAFGADGVGGVLSVGARWYRTRPPATVAFAQAVESLDDDVQAEPIIREVPGLGQEAVASHDAAFRFPYFSLAVLDRNLMLSASVGIVAPDDASWRSGEPDEAFAVLAEVARTALDRIT